MNLNDFVDTWLGRKADYDGAYGGQCVDIFRFYVEMVLAQPQPRGVEGAANFWSNYDSDPNLNKFFDKIPNTSDGVPNPGDVVLWNRRAGGGFGHVSIFLNGDANSFTSLDQNWPTLSKVTKTEHNYTNVYGWLRPKGQPMAGELETCLKDRQKFWDERDATWRELGVDSVEGAKSTIAGYKSRMTDLGNQVGRLQAEVDNRKEQVSRVEEQLLTVQSLLKSSDTALKKANDQVEKFAQEKGALTVKVAQLETQLETARQQGGFTVTMGELFSLLWNHKITIGRKK